MKTVNLVTFNEEILNRELLFFEKCRLQKSQQGSTYRPMIGKNPWQLKKTDGLNSNYLKKDRWK